MNTTKKARKFQLITEKYINCKAVFQGGGCKAITYVGAFEEAINCGVGFSEFAGASAGAMIAAFAAAGATPQQMRDFVAGTDFSVLLREQVAMPLNWKQKLLIKGICYYEKIPSNWVKYAMTVYDRQGMYDSTAIYSMVDAELQKLLGISTTIRFEDMKYPLTIVAADIKEHKLKIWSTTTTPHDSVAKAVQCSCSIPVIFKPVDGRYVDGGLLSNLPAMVFAENLYDFNRILAFSFKGTNGSSKNKFIKYISDIANTNIEGSTEIQQKLTGTSLIIRISTTLGLLDFDKFKGIGETRMIKNAYQSGATAVHDFINNENNHCVKELVRPVIFSNIEQVYSQVAHHSKNVHDVIVVSMPDYVWVRKLFLYLVKWRNDGTEVYVYVGKKQQNDVHYFPMSKTLKYLGVAIQMLDVELPVSGFFFKKDSIWKGIVTNWEMSDKGFRFVRAKNLFSETDNCINQSLIKALISVPTQRIVFGKPFESAELIYVDENDVVDVIRSVDSFRQCGVSVESVNIDSVIFEKTYVAGYQYRSIEYLVDLYGKETLFRPAKIKLASGKYSLMTPIVVIEKNRKYVVITGNARLLYAFKHKYNNVLAVVIRDYNPQLEMEQTYHVSEIFVSDKTTSDPDYVKTDFKLRSEIEKRVRPYNKYLK